MCCFSARKVLREHLFGEATTHKRPSFEKSGDEIGRVYHAGKTKLKNINPAKLNTQDPGYYGEGFYVGASPRDVRSYGSVTSVFDVDPKARVLMADWRMGKVDPSLVLAIREHVSRLPGIKKKEDPGAAIEKEMRFLRQNQIEWVHRVDDFAVEKHYDIVWFSPEEIVVKNVRVLHFVDAQKSVSMRGL